MSRRWPWTVALTRFARGGGFASLAAGAALAVGLWVVGLTSAAPALGASSQSNGTFVTGFVYYDLNGNGRWDPGEPRAPGATIAFSPLPPDGPERPPLFAAAVASGDYQIDDTVSQYTDVQIAVGVNNAVGKAIASGSDRLAIPLGQTITADVGLRFTGAPRPGCVDCGYYAETQFETDPVFFGYFDYRGGVGTFGYPVSRLFLFQGFPTQIFQRVVLQEWPDGSVHLLNLLDPGLLPFSSFNGAVVPAYDPTLVARAPAPGSPGSSDAVVQFVQANAPNTFAGQPVNFGATFLNTVSVSTAYPPIPPLSYCQQHGLPDSRCTRPPGYGNLSLLPGFDLEIWGIPTSLPMVDPHNHDFIYQRFQRGILHFQEATNTTEGLLLGDYFKDLLTGQDLPADIAAEAANSPYLDQYCRSGPHWICRPDALDPTTTDLTGAFEPEAFDPENPHPAIP
ncbi:MAG TPA: hypothetical protein VNL16_05015 [Chloroflexota bacterium]|nr:hypothetical protein [Chloroflexota bacterium]